MWCPLVSITLNRSQWLIQKEKIDIDSVKGAQISMLADKIDESILSFRSPNKPYITFIFYFLVIVADLIKKLELHIMVVSVLFKIKFGHVQIYAPKIGIPMSKTACINPCPE